MIEIARRHETTLNSGISYVVDDAQRLSGLEDASFDGATCQLGLMDIPDLAATLAALHRVIKPRGWFVFVIGHPCFLAPHAASTTDLDGKPAVRVSGYFDERFWRSSNPNGVRRVGNYHRRLSTYLNALTRCGFRLDISEEPDASPMLAEQQPLYRQVPIFFAARTWKALDAAQ
jgi:SAM-dependent methyltransferase